MKKQRKHADPLLRAKNIMRGVLNKPLSTVWMALARAREAIDANRFEEFTEWLFKGQSLSSQRILLSPVRTLDFMTPFVFVGNMSLIRELTWTAAILKNNYNKLSDIFNMSQKINEFAVREDTRSIDLLDEIEKSYGKSFWGLELRIALLQAIYGIEEQKEFVHQMWDNDNDYIPFFSYWFSKRNEPATKITNYFRSVNGMISNSKDNPLAQLDYVRFKLQNILPDSDERLAGVLRSELSTSAIDLYETFLAICEKSLSQHDQYFNEYIIRLLNKMSIIGDTRIEKLIAMYRAGHEKNIRDNCCCTPRDIYHDDLFMRGKYEEALGCAMSYLSINSFDPFTIDCCARTLACLEDTNVDKEYPGKSIVMHLSTVYLKGKGWKESYYHLLKSSLNFRNLFVYSNTFGFALRDSLNGMLKLKDIERSLIVRSPYLEPNEFRTCVSDFKPFMHDHCESAYKGSARLQFEIINDEGMADGFVEESLSPEMRTIAQINNSIKKGEYEEAFQFTRQLISNPRKYFAREATLLAVFTLFKMDKYQEMLKEIVRGCLEEQELRHALSLRIIFSNLTWNELRPLSGTIELPIVLSVYLSDYEDDRHRTNLRYAFEEFLLKNNIDRPSELRDILGKYDRDHVIYFLRHIAKQEIMDICLTFRSSLELDEERMNVCLMLVEIDPANREIYESELFEITKKIRIQEGLQLVDRSRVFVDISALKRWSERELRELFNRYRALAPLKLQHGKTDLDAALLDFLKNKEPLPGQFLQVPNNEGDDLLIQMVFKVLDGFFRNPEFGFEFFLSTRVRHGSLSGHLRGPLEEHHLITFKDQNTKQYRPIEYWYEKVPSIDEQQKSAMTDAFLALSKEYDEIIDLLTQEYLQIFSSSKPLGIFIPSINTVSLHLLKEHAQRPETTFENFIDNCVETSWNIIKEQLAIFRTLLNDQVKVDLLKLFTSLASKLKQIFTAYQYIPLGTEISLAQTEVQSVIDRVAAWFLLPEGGGSDVYMLEQVIDIGIEFTKNARRGFFPKIERKIIGDIRCEASSLARIVDCIFIMLDNVYRHSGVTNTPHVSLLVERQDERKVLRIRMESEVAEGIRSQDHEDKIERIERTIKNGEYRTHVKAEGGSGLIKLNRMAADADSFSFGFGSDDNFCVEVCIPFIILERANK